MPTSHGNCNDEEYTLPSAEALLGCTLALMTGLSQASCARHRELIARKIVANLAGLTTCPQLSVDFRHLLDFLRQRWEAQQGVPEDQRTATAASMLWHKAPAPLQ